MTRARKQLVALLRVALVQDGRLGGAFRGRHSRSQMAFLLTLLLYFFVGVALALGAAAELPPLLRLSGYLATAGIFVAFNVLTEYQHILLSPNDIDVLYWRPIGARTLFLARCLHILVYVCGLSAVLLFAPTVALLLEGLGGHVALAFCAAAALNAVAAASIVVLAYATLLRYVARERVHDALAWLQVVMAIVVLGVYQWLDPVLERLDLRAAPVPVWLHLFPAAWFAHLPASLLEPAAGDWVVFAAGVAVLLVGAALAGRALAPHYAANLVESAVLADARPSEQAAPPRRARLRSLPRRTATALLGRDPLRRAGFDFLLAQLRGDRRLKLSLLPALAMPVVYLCFGLLTGGAWDPYVNDLNTTGFMASEGAQASATGAVQEAGRSRGAIYGAVYLLIMVSLLTLRSLSTSPSWRAAWVFFAAPTSRFDSFYMGVLLGAVYALLLPVLVLVGAILLLAWRQPMHALAHLTLPVGACLLGTAILLALEPRVPFAREPMRHERAWNLASGFMLLVPLGLLASVHYVLRSHPSFLVVTGVLACVAGAICFLPARRRLRLLPREQSFDA